MRIAIVHGRKYYLRNITTTLEALAERDHELVFSMSERKAFTRRVPRTLRDHPRISMAIYPAHRDDGLDGGQRLVRALRDAGRYETPELRSAHANRTRAYRKLQETLTRAGVSLVVKPPDHFDQGDRAAFDAVVKDAEFLAEAKKRQWEIAPVSGERLEVLAKEVIQQPADIVERMKKVMGES